MLSIQVLCNENNEFLQDLPTINNIYLHTFSLEEKKQIEHGNIQDDIYGVIINNSNDYLNEICLFIKKRIPIFICDFHNLSPNKAKRLLDLHEEAASYIQVNSSNRFVFKDVNYWQRIENPQLISITKSFNTTKRYDLIELIHIEIENIIAIIKSKPRKITPVHIPKKTEEIQTIDVRIEFDNGAILKMTVSCILPESTHTIEFIKWNNYQKIDLINCVYIHNESKEKFTKVTFPQHTEITHFCTNLLNNKLPDVNIEDGIVTIELIDKIIC